MNTMHTMNAADKLTKAMIQLMYNHPFFSAIIMRLKRIEACPEDKIDTMGTDGGSLFYSAQFVNSLSMVHLVTVLAHEALHLTNMHHLRQGGRQSNKWNIACDLAINPILKECGLDCNFPDPPGFIYYEPWKGMSAEEIYHLLPDMSENEESSFNDCSSIGDISKPKGPGNRPMSEGERMAAEMDMKQQIMSAALIAKQRGKVPAFVSSVLDDFARPQISWKQELAAFLTEKQSKGTTWNRGNRRYLAQGLYLPGRGSSGDGHIVVVIDTSGSIAEKELAAFGAEVKGIMMDVNPRAITVIYCDAAIIHVDEFHRSDELTFGRHGGGGTSFHPPFEWLAERGLCPSALVYLTDGYGDGFPAPGFPVLWVINNKNIVPDTGTHIVLDME